MRQAVRENALCAAMAVAGCATLAWLGLYGYAWSDYDNEARAAFGALAHGHVLEFLRLAPAYGGSLVERAPFALAPRLWGGGEEAIYRMVALPCLLAAAGLGVWLLAQMRRAGHSRSARALALALCVANPITLRALELGHPEELLGACLSIFALLLASGVSVSRRRALLAGVVLGLAIANKEWALIAVGPVLLALPGKRRLACVAGAAVSAAAVLAPLVLSSSSYLHSTKALASAPGAIFQPWQLWWFLGHHGGLVHGAFGVAKPGYREASAWAATINHPLILAVAAAFTLALWLRHGRLSAPDALLALAALALARSVLDTWDTIYYMLPFLLALLCWETRVHTTRLPVLAAGCTALTWVSFQWLGAHVSPDAQAAFFLAWSVPLAVWLTARLLSPGRSVPRPVRSRHTDEVQPRTVSALGRLLRTS
ncbi:MAG: hypothetical protein QOI03_1557 [Solirubrobacteraceae bacterium]|jgi:hypothetical protein|nr:hypothetical protein [Solirubrobacteraceae bacterium]